jgi:hypothetical protein
MMEVERAIRNSIRMPERGTRSLCGLGLLIGSRKGSKCALMSSSYVLRGVFSSVKGLMGLLECVKMEHTVFKCLEEE